MKKDQTAPDVGIEEDGLQEEVGMGDASDTPGMEQMHRINLMSLLMHDLGKLSKGEMVDLYHKQQALIGKEASTIPDGASAHNQASIRMHPSDALGSIKEAIKEDLATVFGEDTNLSEEFKGKMTTLFESAVSARVALIEATILDSYEQALEEEVSTVTEDLLGKMDDYLGYVCEEWIKENEVAIQSSLMSEITSDFIEDLREVFTRHSISVPEGREDICEMMAQKIEELEDGMNEIYAENMELKGIIENTEKAAIVSDFAEGLTEIQSQKLVDLAAGVDASTPEEFADKLSLIKEAHFPEAAPALRKKAASSTNLIVEEIAYDPNAPEGDESKAKPITDPDMKALVHGLKRTIRQTVAH